MDNVSNSENAVSIDVRLRNIVRRYLNNEKIEMDSDLYELGLDSIATLGLILELEDELDLELPDAVVDFEMFRSVSSCLTRLRENGVIDSEET